MLSVELFDCWLGCQAGPKKESRAPILELAWRRNMCWQSISRSSAASDWAFEQSQVVSAALVLSLCLGSASNVPTILFLATQQSRQPLAWNLNLQTNAPILERLRFGESTFLQQKGVIFSYPKVSCHIILSIQDRWSNPGKARWDKVRQGPGYKVKAASVLAPCL